MYKFIQKLPTFFFVLFVGLYFAWISYFHFAVSSKITKYNNTYEIAVNFYEKFIWSQYLPTINELSSIDKSKWKESQQYLNFASDSFSYWSNTPIIKLNIYNENGDRLISTAKENSLVPTRNNKISNLNDISILLDKLVFQLIAQDNNPPLKSALEGIANSSIELSVNYMDGDGFIKTGTLLNSFIPIFSKDKKVTGVIECSRDLTDQWNGISYFKFLSIIFFSFIIFCIYLINNYKSNQIKQSLEIKQVEILKLQNEQNLYNIQNSRRTQFLNNISKAIKIPLTNISELADNIKSEAYGPLKNPTYQEYITDIYNYSAETSDLVSEIIEFSESHSAYLTINCIPTEIRKILISAIHLLNLKSKSAALEIVKDIPDENVIIVADPKKLKQAIINIISNSIKFTPPGGKILLSIQNDIDEQACNIVKIIIEDTGIGMNESEISTTFTNDQDINHKLNINNNGIGIGIPYTRNLIENMNGKFSIESKLGIGTKVTFSFYQGDGTRTA